MKVTWITCWIYILGGVSWAISDAVCKSRGTVASLFLSTFIGFVGCCLAHVVRSFEK